MLVKMTNSALAWCGVVLIATAVAPTATLASASFTPLGLVPGGGGSIALGVSQGGHYVVGNASAPGLGGGETEAFRWTTGGGYQFLGQLPGGANRSFADRVSLTGNVIVGRGNSGSSDPAAWEAFRWTPGGGMVGLGYLEPGHNVSEAYGLSYDGSVIAGMSRQLGDGTSSRAFRWTESDGMQSLGVYVAGGRSNGNGISGDGNTIVGSVSLGSGELNAARWTEADGWQTIGDLPGGNNHSTAWAASFDGSVIAGDSSSANSTAAEAFRWTEGGGMQGLGFLNAGGFRLSTVGDMSADGSIIVGSSTPSGPWGDFSQAFIWIEGLGMRNLRLYLTNQYGLNLAGWDLVGATGISADGNTIVGWGWNPDGLAQGWLVKIPEPSTLTLLAFGGAALLRRRRR